MKYQLATVITTAAVAANLRQLAFYLDRDDMGGMFAHGFSATGAAPATHFISSGHTPKPFIRCMRNSTLMFTTAKAAWEANGEVFPFTQAQVTNRLNACAVVSAPNDTEGALPETPQQTMTRLGLLPVARTFS